MIELIEGLPDDVVGFEAVGTVTMDGYEAVVAPASTVPLKRTERSG